MRFTIRSSAEKYRNQLAIQVGFLSLPTNKPSLKIGKTYANRLKIVFHHLEGTKYQGVSIGLVARKVKGENQ
jgi:hypothetical protein